MREIPKIAAVMIALLSAAISDGANAGISNMSRGLRAQLERIQLSAPALAPMAHVRFCMDYPAECTVRRLIFRGGPVKLTSSRWSDVVQVNNTVNGTIVPTANLGGLATETWIVGPRTGDCNDYAVMKRHELTGVRSAGARLASERGDYFLRRASPCSGGADGVG